MRQGHTYIRLTPTLSLTFTQLVLLLIYTITTDRHVCSNTLIFLLTQNQVRSCKDSPPSRWHPITSTTHAIRQADLSCRVVMLVVCGIDISLIQILSPKLSFYVKKTGYILIDTKSLMVQK